MVISTVPDLSELRRVDMLTRPVAAVRAVVATGVLGSIETRHVSDRWKCGGFSFILPWSSCNKMWISGLPVALSPVSTPG